MSLHFAVEEGMVINVHITPRERERLIREERQRRRIARILQVRQQTAENAQLIREHLRNEKKSKMDKIRKELRRSISEKVSEVASETEGAPRIPLPSCSSSISTSAPKGCATRTPRRHRRIFTKEDAKKALERGKLAHERLLAERAAARKKALEATRLRREAAKEANKFNKANPTT